MSGSGEIRFDGDVTIDDVLNPYQPPVVDVTKTSDETKDDIYTFKNAQGNGFKLIDDKKGGYQYLGRFNSQTNEYWGHKVSSQDATRLKNALEGFMAGGIDRREAAILDYALKDLSDGKLDHNAKDDNGNLIPPPTGALGSGSRSRG